MQMGRKVKSLTGMKILSFALAGVILLGGLSGCNPEGTIPSETDERAYRRGKSLQREGRREEALQAFLSVISSRLDAAESNLEAGLIYLNHIKDPLAAIYHFRTYLALNPDGEHTTFVQELILTAQRDFAKTLPGEPFGDAIERVNMMERVKELREENTLLKEQILQLQREMTTQEGDLLRYREALAISQRQPAQLRDVAPIIIQLPREDRSPAAGGSRIYTVQPGDTLSRISAQVYGQTGRWSEIFEANRDQLPSPNALKPGQVLRIP